MRLIAFGGDDRMLGAVDAARRAGWETLHIRDEAPQEPLRADAVLLPWPHSFREGRLVGGGLAQAQVLAMLPPCRVLLRGSGAEDAALTRAERVIDPGQDEAFVQVNAELTAEGAIACAMQRPGRALRGATCLVTGFGRIGQALTVRLTALGAFVIVCARSEKQMQAAHALGAHPVPLAQIASACAQAEVIWNTVPARILGENALERVGRDAQIIELASPPYGADPELAARMGVAFTVEGGLPGRYAPLDAGAALFDALQRAMTELKGGRANG